MARKKELSQEELKQRMDTLKRFRELLKAQRDRFQAYLSAMDRQKDTIERGTADELIRHVELEEKIVADIFSIQKVIDPLDTMYKTINLTDSETSGNENIINLKSTLDELKKEAVARSQRNKNLLSKRMAEIRAEIKSIRSNPYSRKQSAYSGTPSLIDLKG